METKPKLIIRAFAMFLALMLLNISVSSNFFTLTASTEKKSDSAPNNIESLFELITEVGFNIEDAFPESDKDNSPINEEIKVVDYIQPQSALSKVCDITILQEFDSYKGPVSAFISDITSPPPKA